MRNKYHLFAMFIFVNGFVLAEGTMRNAVRQIVDLCNTSQWCSVSNVDDTGINREIFTNTLFLSSVSLISNSWSTITNEWPLLRDNESSRIVFRNMAGFAGTNAFLGILNHVADDAMTNLVSRKVFIDMATAPRTPLWMFIPDHFSEPAVSNLMSRARPIFEGDGNATMFIDTVLSGEYKRYLDDARAGGAIEY